MKNLGFIRCAVTAFAGQVSNCDYNSKEIVSAVKKADSLGVNILLFPQLCITSATCGDLFYQRVLLDAAKKSLLEIAEATSECNVLFAVGLPFSFNNALYSVQAILQGGQILGIVPVRNNLPQFDSEVTDAYNVISNFGVDYFIPFGQILFSEDSFTFSVGNDCCADVVLSPQCVPSFAGNYFNNSLRNCFDSEKESCIILFANSGIGESTDENVFAGECGIYSLGTELCKNSFLDLTKVEGTDIFNKHSFAFSDVDVELVSNHRLNKKLVQPEFVTVDFNLNLPDVYSKDVELVFPISKEPFLPKISSVSNAISNAEKKLLENEFYSDILNMQAIALAKRLDHIGCKKVIVGVSGGTDSTFVLLTSARCFDILSIPRNNIYAITMPCFGTTKGTKQNATELAKILGCSFEEINIENSVKAHFKDINQSMDEHNTAFENAQARERTQVLMDKANQIGGLVLGGSDLSEIALGWSTYGGDHMCMYNLNSAIPKTVLRKCIDYCKRNASLFGLDEQSGFSKVLSSVLDTPISPELLPADKNKILQKTEEILGSYELHDFFLYHSVVNAFSPQKVCFLAERSFCKDDNYSHDEIKKYAKLFFKRFFQNQFKRSTAPVGASVLDLSLSARSGWKIPGDVNSKIWLDFFSDKENDLSK